MRRCIGSSWMRRSAACTDVRGPPSAADAPSALPCRHSPPTRPVGSRAALHRPSPPTRPVPSAADEAGAPVPPSAADTPGGLPRRPSPPTRPVPAAADEAGTLPFHPSPPMSSCNRLSRMGVGGDIGLTFFRSSQVPEVPAGGREEGSAVLPSEGMRGTSTGVGTSFPSDSYHAHKRLSEGCSLSIRDDLLNKYAEGMVNYYTTASNDSLQDALTSSVNLLNEKEQKILQMENKILEMENKIEASFSELFAYREKHCRDTSIHKRHVEEK